MRLAASAIAALVVGLVVGYVKGIDDIARLLAEASAGGES